MKGGIILKTFFQKIKYKLTKTQTPQENTKKCNKG